MLSPRHVSQDSSQQVAHLIYCLSLNQHGWRSKRHMQKPEESKQSFSQDDRPSLISLCL